MPETPLTPPQLITGPARTAADIASLRETVSGLERTYPTTIVKDTDPAGTMIAGTVWVNKLTARVFISVGDGTWISADAQRRSGFVAGPDCTTSTAAVALGGPTIDIYVPPNGIVGFWADAELQGQTVSASTYAAIMGVYDAIDIPAPMTVLQSVNTVYERRVSAAGGTFGTTIPYGGWVVHRATPGLHTYRAGYASAGGGANVCFRNRRLWAATF